MSKEPIEMEDEDVAAEKERVLSGGASGDLIRIENLTKVSKGFGETVLLVV